MTTPAQLFKSLSRPLSLEDGRKKHLAQKEKEANPVGPICPIQPRIISFVDHSTELQTIGSDQFNLLECLKDRSLTTTFSKNSMEKFHAIWSVWAALIDRQPFFNDVVDHFDHMCLMVGSQNKGYLGAGTLSRWDTTKHVRFIDRFSLEQLAKGYFSALRRKGGFPFYLLVFLALEQRLPPIKEWTFQKAPFKVVLWGSCIHHRIWDLTRTLEIDFSIPNAHLASQHLIGAGLQAYLVLSCSGEPSISFQLVKENKEESLHFTLNQHLDLFTAINYWNQFEFHLIVLAPPMAKGLLDPTACLLDIQTSCYFLNHALISPTITYTTMLMPLCWAPSLQDQCRPMVYSQGGSAPPRSLDYQHKNYAVLLQKGAITKKPLYVEGSLDTLQLEDRVLDLSEEKIALDPEGFPIFTPDEMLLLQ